MENKFKKKRCSICGKEYTGWGNNAQQIQV